MDDKKQPGMTNLEEQLEAMLTAGDMQAEDVSEGARKRLLRRTEIRVQTMMDPIVEETIQYRQIAKEVDGRYDEYMNRASGGHAESKEE